ncbi:MAG TPA: RagB/SusD family nutrient uptake outer membrane protein [Flavisolibacter sp.]|jgi:hypothetical protein|nr:RagB/SusD family nutrient uptake outer membrane protein [Flavisolibacter sp.]
MFKNKFIISALGMALLATGCKKELDLSPTDTFNETNAYLNVLDLQKGTYTAYSRYNYENTMYINAVLSDEVKFGVDNAGQGQFEYKWTYQSDPTSGGGVTAGWSSMYSMIDQINRVLGSIDQVPATGSDDAKKQSLKGQMLALRALGHLELLERYSGVYNASAVGVPIMTVSNLLGKPARSTMGDVVAQIEKDLTDAKAILSAPSAANYQDTIINQITANAIHARVALYKKDWQNAVNYATTVINSNVKPLASGATFTDIWTDNSNAEILFRIKRTGTSAGAIFTTTGGQVYFSPSDKIIAQYGATDVRKTAYFNTVSGKPNVKKFYSSSLGGGIVDVKAIRTAEMYLIRAEANTELNKLTEAAADLNLLRSKRITPYADATFADQATLRDAIVNERFKELAYEGFRFFDLKRKGLPVQRQASDVQSTQWQNLAADNFRFILPLPAFEILANPNITQNNGY